MTFLSKVKHLPILETGVTKKGSPLGFGRRIFFGECMITMQHVGDEIF